MPRRLLIAALIAALLGASVAAQWVVFDPTNYASALERLWELQRQYTELVRTYQQIRAQYEYWVRMARRVPVDMLSRYRALVPSWRSLVSTDTYGNAGGWATAANTGELALDGYRLATQALRTYGAALSRLPADEQARLRARYATAELADATTVLGLQTVGRVRWRGPSIQATVLGLEADAYSGNDEMHTLIGVLNKINAAGVLALQHTQSTNQLLVSLLEDRIIAAKRAREQEVASINLHIAFVTQARPYLERVTAGTTDALAGFVLP